MRSPAVDAVLPSRFHDTTGSYKAIIVPDIVCEIMKNTKKYQISALQWVILIHHRVVSETAFMFCDFFPEINGT
jgi:hypothetical protein